MLFWRPHPENPALFFGIAGLWGKLLFWRITLYQSAKKIFYWLRTKIVNFPCPGVGDAVWQTQINGLYGLLFRRNKEAAFSNYRLWESAGFVIAYAYSTTLCARMKLYLLFGNLVLGIIGYVIVEIRHRRKVRIQRTELSPNEPNLNICCRSLSWFCKFLLLFDSTGTSSKETRS